MRKDLVTNNQSEFSRRGVFVLRFVASSNADLFLSQPSSRVGKGEGEKVGKVQGEEMQCGEGV